MGILAIDPGNRYTGVVLYDPAKKKILFKNVFENQNDDVVTFLRSVSPPFPDYEVEAVVVEGVKSYGMAVGEDVFSTAMWIGEFRRTCKNNRVPFQLIYRKSYVTFLTGSPRAKDPNVRAALIERWGYEKQAIGGKRCKKCNGNGVTGHAYCPVCEKRRREPCCGEDLIKDPCPACKGSTWEYPPGPLYGVVSHMWPALAMAVYAAENEKE